MMKKLKLMNGFSLVEVTLALGIAAFTLIAIFGLLPMGLASSQNASEQTIAANAASTIVADLRQASAGATTTPLYSLSMNGGVFRLDEGGVPIGLAGGRYRASLNITGPSSSKPATMGVLTITWPADAAPANAIGKYQTFFALNRN